MPLNRTRNTAGTKATSDCYRNIRTTIIMLLQKQINEDKTYHLFSNYFEFVLNRNTAYVGINF